MAKSENGILSRFVGWIERVGNKLPHIFWIFLFFWLLVILLSGVLLAYLQLHRAATRKSKLSVY